MKSKAQNIQEDLLIASISKSKLILSSEDKNDKATEFTRME
ncbi:unknown [Prevotella sp. CAG:279]|nr:unknown [Prevotella sp. CAG:279]